MKDHDQIQRKNQLESLFEKFGFSELTKIQKKASPLILQKKDCLVIAPTGSGKTECSVVPIFSLLRNSKKNGKIKALYITPLRALNRDVFRRITKYAHGNELSIEIRHGDTTQKDRKKLMKVPQIFLLQHPKLLLFF